MSLSETAKARSDGEQKPAIPSLSLPKGGGAIRGMGEKFAANPVMGTGSMAVPIATSPGRSGFGPQLSLSYDSGSGNGPFGFGWSLSLPSITRKTDKGLPQYLDTFDSDVFILSGAEDLVPVYRRDAYGTWVAEHAGYQRDPESLWVRYPDGRLVIHEDELDGYRVRRYRPRTEGLFARIERWTSIATGEIHWRSISKDNILTVYGRDNNSRIFDPKEIPAFGHIDDARQKRIFSWLICETRDDKGNAVVYEYKAEDGLGVDLTLPHQRNRGDPNDPRDPRRTSNRYIKHIRYGNRQSLLDNAGHRPHFLTAAQIKNADWMFEMVFDYGEHDKETPKPDDSGDWVCRPDPFSNYRAGFEVRTNRCCQRVLMFHHFPHENAVRNDCLVRSTDFKYSQGQNPSDADNPVYTFLRAIAQTGYRRSNGGYLKRSLPPVEFKYSQPIVQDTIEEIGPDNLENLPFGVDGATSQWTDLHGEGIPGILSEQGGAWFYKRNFSPVNEDKKVEFGPVERIAVKPNLSLSGGVQFMDLAGDGQPDLAVMDGPVPGIYEHDGNEGWQPFRPFKSRLNRDFSDPNLKFIDLDGDGHADVLVTENEAFTWHASLAEDGFGPGRRVAQVLDEEDGPRLVFADGSQSIYLSDMSGDGLTDIVRIRNGEISYWPNLGYCRFGARVCMDHAPWFDNPDQFDQRRIRMADIDGSGTTDIIYLHRDGVRLYFNQSGNSWSEPQTLRVFPRVDDIVSIVPADLLGNGTACLVWSSPLPNDATRPMRYVNLMGGQKPHLLIKTINNLGAENHIHYAPSTKFYLQDKRDGKPWITRLPFPVHVVERVETYDRVGRNHFVTRYAYHHGYFDADEREFRGFGMVEQWDSEEFNKLDSNVANVAAEWYVPSVHTKTWFHNGAYVRHQEISRRLAQEYFGAPQDKAAFDAWAKDHLLEDTVFPEIELRADEQRQAVRALKGAMLRQEVYADDAYAGASPEVIRRAETPYTITEQNYTIRQLQPQNGNRHAVFFTHPREAVTYHYERNPADPRISHALTLDVDKYGNVLRSIAVSYPRANTLESQPEQGETHVTLTMDRFANLADQPSWYRVGVPFETRTYEVVKPPTAAQRFSWDEVSKMVTALVPPNQHDPPMANTIPYEQWDWRKMWNPQNEPGGLINNAPQHTRLRIIEHIRTLYRNEDLTSLLPLGKVGPLSLPGESYKLAFTPGLLTQVFQRLRDDQPPEKLLSDHTIILGGKNGDQGGYVDLDGNDHWWIPSGRVYYDINASPADPASTAAQELTTAREHFFLPRKFTDPFGQSTLVDYDDYYLLVKLTMDAIGNTVQAFSDYRVLQPAKVIDPNNNYTEAVFDALGMVAATAIRGKVTETNQAESGDTLDGFDADLTQDQLDKFYDVEAPHTSASDLLNQATTRIIYDLDQFRNTRIEYPDEPEKWLPVYAATLARETHVSAGGSKIQISFSYSDGFGREIQKKIQAEPETPGGPLRWIGSGWTIFNNKGKPVRKYEPFFSKIEEKWHRFEYGVEEGVSPTLFYDPLGRVMATLHPNHTYEKVVFDAWQQTAWDVNDTVLGDPRTDSDIKGYVTEYFKAQPADWQTWYTRRQNEALGKQEQIAADKASAHAETPPVACFNSLGRTFLTVADSGIDQDGNERKYQTKIVFDIEGNQREVIDAEGRIVMRYDYDIAGPDDNKDGEDEEESNWCHQASMEAGERYVLKDVAGNPIRFWDSRGHEFTTEYDALRRPVKQYVRGIDANQSDPRTLGGNKILYEKIEYGEGPLNDKLNLRTRVFKTYDNAGVVTNAAYDFKGNLLHSSRTLAEDFDKLYDWGTDTVQQSWEVFSSSTAYDALNRPVELIAPHSNNPGTKRNTIRPAYNEANLLERVHANLQGSVADGQPVWTPFVTNIDYDAKGQRTRIDYGNGASTSYSYDELTFRLIRLSTVRGKKDLSDCSPILNPRTCKDPPANCNRLTANKCIIQNFHYTYDPAGNITHIRDAAQQIIFFRNKIVKPSNDYTYDALYRLIEATGREHLGQAGGSPIPHSYNDSPRVGINWSANDGNAMGTYIERYVYDAVGNILEMCHRGEDPAHNGWKRVYEYKETSLIETGVNGTQKKCNNRLTHTVINPNSNNPIPEPYTHDAHGNMTIMPHLKTIMWDFEDRLHMSRRQVVNENDAEGVGHHGDCTWYVYDASGERVRKVTRRQNGDLKNERIYLGGSEIYRQYNGNGQTITLERETLHIMDDKQRIALVETRTKGRDKSAKTPQQLLRYQIGNHLGSVGMELDHEAQIVSYEEYTPYGSTSYKATTSRTEVPKRYRYTGKERDEESGLYYYGIRYYTCVLARWISVDKIDEFNNSYIMVSGNPVRLFDPNGLWGVDMHFAAVYLAGRMSGTPHKLALQVSIASQSLDDFPETAAPDMILTALGAPLTIRNSLLNRARNAHALGTPKWVTETVAKTGVAEKNSVLFGLGLHTLIDYFSHANETGSLTFGHQWKKCERYSSSSPFNHTADWTSHNPQKALASFEELRSYWHTYLDKGRPKTLSKSEIAMVGDFFTGFAWDARTDELQNILALVGIEYGEFKEFAWIYKNEMARKQEWRKLETTMEGASAKRQAWSTWSSIFSNAKFLTNTKEDLSSYININNSSINPRRQVFTDDQRKQTLIRLENYRGSIR